MPPPAGLKLLGFQIEIDAPAGTRDRPLALVFKLDASVINGLDPNRISPIRDGELAGECPGSSTADPDPCVSDRVVDATTGDLTLRVNAQHASTWNLAEVPKRCLVPDLIGLKLAKAKKALSNAKCKLGKVKEKPSKQKAGTVIRQKPKPGTPRPVGAKVAVTVSQTAG